MSTIPSANPYKPNPMKQPVTKKNPYQVSVRTAAHAARTTPKKMRESLDAIGCPVNSEGVFGMASLLEAVVVNCHPARMRQDMVEAVKESAAKVFGKAIGRKVKRAR